VTGVRIAVLAALCAVGTVVLGWWALLVVGMLRGMPLLPGRGTAPEAAAAGALGWLVLLAWSAMSGPVGRLAGDVGPIFHLPAWAVFAVTLGFAAVAAGAAAALARQVARRD